jgi:hypothetical protein
MARPPRFAGDEPFPYARDEVRTSPLGSLWMKPGGRSVQMTSFCRRHVPPGAARRRNRRQRLDAIGTVSDATSRVN